MCACVYKYSRTYMHLHTVAKDRLNMAQIMEVHEQIVHPWQQLLPVVYTARKGRNSRADKRKHTIVVLQVLLSFVFHLHKNPLLLLFHQTLPDRVRKILSSRQEHVPGTPPKVDEGSRCEESFIVQFCRQAF